MPIVKRSILAYTGCMPAKRVAKRPKAPAKPRAKTVAAPRVHAGMNVMDIVALHPQAASVLGEYGLHCVGCAFNTLESLEEGALNHGLSEHDIELIVADLQRLLAAAPSKPATLTMSPEAARALLKIAEADGKKGYGLRVGTDEQGAFCMEFEQSSQPDDLVFVQREVPELPFFAAPETLWRIGGSHIDYRDGRFKLDLAKTCCGGKDSCACGKQS